MAAGGKRSTSMDNRRSRILNRTLFVEAFECRRLMSLSPVFVDQINTASTLSSSPTDFTAFDGELYFKANDGIHGFTELFKTDGTTTGTMLVADVNPGIGGASVGN